VRCYNHPRPFGGGCAMPIHDWTRVDAGIFHSFYLGWIGILKKTLNVGLLPPNSYALAEQVARGSELEKPVY
jgi:hypothetical protein